jgi:Cu-processing system permease protein
MQVIITIAKNTFRQMIRDKILYGIVIFALIFLGSTVVLSSLSLGEDIFIIRNLGLAGIYLFGLIITIFLGASIVYDEIEKKTTYFLIAKPVTRSDVIIGKFLGLLSAIGTTTLLMLGVYLLIVISNGGSFDYMAIGAVLLQLLEMGILISFLILFSVFTTPLAATIYTILILYIGHLLTLFLTYAQKSGGIIKYMMIAVYYLFPNLEKFNIRNLIVHQIPISPSEIMLSTGYAVVYITLILFFAKSLLNRKEL